MSDERLRDLERRWQAGGGPEDDARLLLERLRGGQLSQDDVELAALLGHPAACAALGRAQGDLLKVCEALSVNDDRRGRAALALAELALPAWTWPRPPEEPVPGEWVRDAVQMLRVAVASPGPGAVEAAQEASGLARDAGYEARDSGLWAPLAAGAVAAAADTLAEGSAGALHAAAFWAASLYSEARVREAFANAILPESMRPARVVPAPEWCGETELLRRRLATGALSPERLALAHALGHGPAGEVLGLAPAEVEPARWLEAVEGAGAVGAEAGVRSLIALAVGHQARDTVTNLAAEAWVLEPTEERALAARSAGRAFFEALVRSIAAKVQPPGAEWAELAARAALVAGTTGCAPVEELRRGLELGTNDLLFIVASEVQPWALGYLDPVRERDAQRRLSP